MLNSARSLAAKLPKASVLHRPSSTVVAPPQTFKVLGLQQIAIGGLDKSALSLLWENAFGLEKIGDFKSERENVDEDILSLVRFAVTS